MITCCGRRGLTSEPDLAYPYMTLRQMKALQLIAGDTKLKKWLALDPKYQPARAIYEELDGKYYNILSGGFIERCDGFGDLADRERGRVCWQHCVAKVKAGKLPKVCIRSGFELTHLSAIGLPELTSADAEPDLYEKGVANCGQRRNIHKHCLTCMKKPAAVGWRSRNPCEKRQASRRSWERRSRRRARSSGWSCGSYLRY